MAAPSAALDVPARRPHQRAATADALLEQSILDWEIAACRALIVLLAGAMVMVVAIGPGTGAELATANLALAVIAIVHFALFKRGLTVLGAQQPARHASLEALRWFGATVEVSFGTAATLIVMRVQGPAWAWTSPVMLVYFLGLIATSFRLRPAMTIYVSVLAAVQTLIVYYALVAPRLDPELVERVPTLRAWAAWERAAWLVLAGGLLAVATHRLRQLALANTKQVLLRQTAVHELERLVSPDVASRALAGALVPGASERRWVTVLFCDLRDFTALCEHRRAEDALTILNAFYERACAIIRANGGHVNKFLGDGVLALFGAPEQRPGHADAAIRCAKQLVRAADELRAKGGVWDELQVGIGLDTGDVVLGALGSSDRLEYTAIGATVNRAARLQALSATTGRRIVLSARTASEIDDSGSLLPLGEATIKGVDRPIRIYTPR